MSEIISLVGSFTLQSLNRIKGEVVGRIEQADVVLDLSAVADVDSAAVSMLLHWQRNALAAGRKLRLASPPESLLSLARLYGVEEFLAFEERAPNA